jgi:hypothetical protein
MDMGYDNSRVYAECAERDVTAVIALRKNTGVRESRLPRERDEWCRLSRGRSAVTRTGDCGPGDAAWTRSPPCARGEAVGACAAGDDQREQGHE